MKIIKNWKLTIRNFRQKRAGFTMVELLVYMGIVAVLLVILTDIFTSSLSAQLESESYATLEHDERFIISRLQYDMLRAESITTPAGIGGSGSSLQLVIDGVTYTYALNGGLLEITNNNGTDQLNSIYSSISNLTFTRIGNSLSGESTIRVSFRITSTITQNDGMDEKDVQTTLGLRPN